MGRIVMFRFQFSDDSFPRRIMEGLGDEGGSHVFGQDGGRVKA